MSQERNVELKARWFIKWRSGGVKSKGKELKDNTCYEREGMWKERHLAIEKIKRMITYKRRKVGGETTRERGGDGGTGTSWERRGWQQRHLLREKGMAAEAPPARERDGSSGTSWEIRGCWQRHLLRKKGMAAETLREREGDGSSDTLWQRW